jgi:tetratricopeptide (TPR) repeat protein
MALADQSLVRAEEVDGETRFRMLDTIREFAAERLTESGERGEIERRHGATYLALAKEAAPKLSGDDQRRWLGRLERDHDNIRAVLDRSTAAGDGAMAIPLAFAMWRYWQKRGHLAEARRRLQAIADAPWSRDDPLLRARVMEALGGVAWWQADLDTMAPAYDEALAIWQATDDRREIVNALYNDSFKYAVSYAPGLSDPERAGLDQMSKAQEIAREIGDERGRANALWGIGNWLYFHDTEDRGSAQFREALGIFRAEGDRTMEAWSLHMLSSAEIRAGKLDESREAVSEALRIFHQYGDISGITLALDDYAALAVAEDDLPRAARLWGAARALSSAGGVLLADFVDQQYEFYSRPNARLAMGTDELERYAAEGRTMTLDESVAYALGTTVDALAPHEHSGTAR